MITSTTRLLSLTVPAGYTTFGLLGLLFPIPFQRDLLGLDPCTPREVSLLRVTGPVIASRDISVALALWTLWWARRDWEMGVVVVAGMVLCAVDCGVVWVRKGWERGLPLTIGGAAWTAIGIRLLMAPES